MKFMSFTHKGSAVRSGVLVGSDVYPLAAGQDLLSFIASQVSQPVLEDAPLAVADVTPLAPLVNPPRIFGIGLNYKEHAAESKMAVQAVPTVFIKVSSSVIGPDADVLLPVEAVQPDYEAELAVVIGKPGYRISPDAWEQHVFGYTILNDISARGVQLATTQWTLGKSFPTFTPMGPVIVGRAEIADPHSLHISLTLNGELMQSANTRDLIFRIPALIAYISSILPLEAGDIISTGTPPGVGLGRTPPRWLQANEEMILQIESIGTLRNVTRAV